MVLHPKQLLLLLPWLHAAAEPLQQRCFRERHLERTLKRGAAIAHVTQSLKLLQQAATIFAPLLTMKTSNIAAPAAPPVSNRRQPVRQTRTNPSRSATTTGVALGDRLSLQGGLENGQNASSAPGFFPAITHFTDSISALPKEIIRHFTLLKEVDAKVFGPEETLTKLVAAVAHAPVQKTKPVPPPSSIAAENIDTTSIGANGPAPTATAGGIAGHENQSHAGEGETDIVRRNLFFQLRVVVSEMLMTLDEKNHVLSTATEALNKQLARADSSYPYIENEISEEARYGSLIHWAYTDKTSTKGNGTSAGERSRRDVAAANNLAAAAAAVHEGETAVSRSESRREAMLARKQRHTHVDSDFDDGRQQHTGDNTAAAKKPQGTAKVRKVADAPATTNGTPLGLGITNGTMSMVSTVSNKRRRIEKPTAATGIGAPGMERSMSTVVQSNGASRAGLVSPRETPAVDGSRKRARGGGAPNAPARKRYVHTGMSRRGFPMLTRYRNNTNTSAAAPPSSVSSPVIGASTVAKEPHRSSPTPTTAQRPPSARARQNSSQSALVDSRQRAQSSASTRPTYVNGTSASASDISNLAGPPSRTLAEAQTPAKDEGNIATEKPIDAKIEPNARESSKPIEKPLKKEDTENSNPAKGHERTTSIHTTTRKASKTSTPTIATFPEPHPPRSRPSRVTETIKRSHKKGAGLAAQQLIAAAAAADDEGSSMQGDDEEDDDESEPRYCYCNQVSYGEMVACDMESCPREWFHLDCVGLTKAPNKNGQFQILVIGFGCGRGVLT